MKPIKRFFDSQKRHFEPEGKWARFHPLFEAFETFFFIPGEAAQNAPLMRDSLDLKRFMSMVIVSLGPALLFGIYNTGLQAEIALGRPISFLPVFLKGATIVLPIIIVSYGVGFFWEVLFATIRKHNISEGFLVTGLLFPLTLPPTIPLWQVAAGISFGVVIGKEIFGGTGRNFLNPALTGRAFLFFAYPASMSGDAVWTVMGKSADGVDAVSAATPLTTAAIPGDPHLVQTTLEQAGYGFSTLFFGTYPGGIGATSVLACLMGAAILILTGVANYRIMAGGVIGVLLASFPGYLLSLFSGGQHIPMLALDPFYHLAMGGFAFGIIFMATDPVSAPGMDQSRWIYGIAIGILTVLIRIFNPAYPEGVMLAILLMNLFAPLLDHMVISARLKKRISNV